ncbi:response regulator transcription factor [Ensifer aridi]|uniref:response regulator transcription factor n=1 Tax=Ensifer aridi TaxID=1708715 RepID=UPI00097C4589
MACHGGAGHRASRRRLSRAIQAPYLRDTGERGTSPRGYSRSKATWVHGYTCYRRRSVDAETIRIAWPVPSDRLRFLSTCKQAAHIVHSCEIDYFDGIVIDVNLPDGNGIEILRAIRRNTNVPLILISGAGTGDSRADAIDLGADDYMMKPFHVRELHARMRRLVTHRSERPVEERKELVSFGHVICDLQRRVLACSGSEMRLTDAEARIIEALYKNRNRNCSKSFLYKIVFFREFDPYDKTLDVYVSRLRKKLKQLSEESGSCIQTVRGSGYRYSEL